MTFSWIEFSCVFGQQPSLRTVSVAECWILFYAQYLVLVELEISSRITRSCGFNPLDWCTFVQESPELVRSEGRRSSGKRSNRSAKPAIRRVRIGPTGASEAFRTSFRPVWLWTIPVIWTLLAKCLGKHTPENWIFRTLLRQTSIPVYSFSVCSTYYCTLQFDFAFVERKTRFRLTRLFMTSTPITVRQLRSAVRGSYYELLIECHPVGLNRFSRRTALKERR